MARASARAVATTATSPARTWEQPQPAAAIRYIPPNVTHDEVAVLRAKGEVCDRYRKWLSTTSREDRGRVCDALGALAKLEDAVADRCT